MFNQVGGQANCSLTGMEAGISQVGLDLIRYVTLPLSLCEDVLNQGRGQVNCFMTGMKVGISQYCGLLDLVGVTENVIYVHMHMLMQHLHFDLQSVK